MRRGREIKRTRQRLRKSDIERKRDTEEKGGGNEDLNRAALSESKNRTETEWDKTQNQTPRGGHRVRLKTGG